MDDLLRWLDDARADERRDGRRQERLLAGVAHEGARLAGTLVDLAERASAVTLRTDTGGAHHGVLRLVGVDFCVIATEAGDVWVALVGITTVRPHPDERHGVAAGDRPSVDLVLHEALARVAGERPRLGFVLAGGERIAGELRGVGADVVTVRLDGDASGVCYVPVSSVRAVFRSG